MELKRVDMPPCNGEYYVSRDGKEIYTTHAHNRHAVGKIEYDGATLYKLKKLKPGARGYHSVKIYDRNQDKRVQVGLHRMVAYAWGNPPENYSELEVDHIDSDPHNNDINNLRWCSHRENLHYAMSKGRWNSWQSRKVVCWETKEVFPSVNAAFEKYKLPGQKTPSGIYDVLAGRANEWHGKHFDYLEKAEADWL